MNIRKNLVSPSKYSVKCPHKLVAKYITVHNTYNNANADAEISYMVRNNSTTSYHFAVDDKEVVQGIPLDRNAWHAGDGGNGKGNRQSIGVEICYSKNGGERYVKAEKNAVKLIAQLLKERGWSIDRVKKHQDWSGKYCPHRILDEGRWDEFKEAIEAELVGKEKTNAQPKPKSLPKKESPKKVAAKPKANLKVDGYLGPETIKALQRYFGTPVDGIISKPSLVVKAMQRWLGTPVDGYISEPRSQMVLALQKRYRTTQDGYISRPSMVIKELQRRLNKGAL